MLQVELVDEIKDGGIGEIIDGGLIVCGDQKALQLITVQPENKKSMDVQAALNGGYLKVGEFLS